MYILIIITPLLSFLFVSLLGRHVGHISSSIITTFGLFISCVGSFVCVYKALSGHAPVYIHMFSWIQSDLIDASWELVFDSLVSIMLLVVCVVSFLVHVYSIEYMKDDPHLPRFMSYLSLFTFFMLILVTSSNFMQLFFGWEGVGLASYLLINFWYTRVEANKSAMKAIIVNRIGDFSLAMGIFCIHSVFYSLDFGVIFSCIPYVWDSNIYFLIGYFKTADVIGALLFIGAVGKSAQLGLHTWLPDAMEGPTPVSALIHAATMVTAGVFLILRCSPLFEYTPTILLVISIVGGMTAFFAATTGMLQHDLKKVIAYSTCSQLGYMVFACGISSYSVSIFHLMNHAFFKALLFLSAGSVIHALSDEQDMRKMGGLVRIIPYTYMMMFIGSLSLMGFPFFTGYYSKDVILEVAYAKYTISGDFSYWLGVISAFFTAFYSIRLVYLTFISNSNGYRSSLVKAHDAPLLMALPLGILCVGSIFVGYLFKDACIGMGTHFWGNAIFIHPNNYSYIDSEFIPTSIKLVPTIFSIFGALLAFVLNHFCYKALYTLKVEYKWSNYLYSFFNNKWYFDNIYNIYIVYPILLSSYTFTFKFIDRGLIEYIGPYGLANTISNISRRITRYQTGHMSSYALYMVFGFMIFYAIITVYTIIIYKEDILMQAAFSYWKGLHLNNNI